jgi:hypothetical protein
MKVRGGTPHAHLVIAGLVLAIYPKLIGWPPLRPCVDGRDKPGHDGYFLVGESKQSSARVRIDARTIAAWRWPGRGNPGLSKLSAASGKARKKAFNADAGRWTRLHADGTSTIPVPRLTRINRALVQ